MAKITYQNKEDLSIKPVPQINKVTASDMNEIKEVVNTNADALDSKADLVGGKVPGSQIPSVALSEFLGEVGSEAEMLALVGESGDWCIRTDEGKNYVIIGEPSSELGNWKVLGFPGSPVTSVNGQTGEVVLGKSDVGLSNVDNTSDSDKPVSTAQAAADALVLDTAKVYADGLVVGLLDDRGNYDASSNLFPSTGGSGPGGVILEGDLWYISVAGTLGGQDVAVGGSIRALTDSPGQDPLSWGILGANIGYVPEDAANKDASNGYAGLTGYSINFKNNAGTFTSLLSNANNAERTYQFQDKDGTIAHLDDLVAGNDQSILFRDGNQVGGDSKLKFNKNVAAFTLGIRVGTEGECSMAIGNNISPTNDGTFAGGWTDGGAEPVLASSPASFNYSYNTLTQTAGHGANGLASAILGGRNGNIPVTSPRSIILGGDGLKMPAATPDTVLLHDLLVDGVIVSDHPILEIAQTNGLQAALDGKIPSTEKGAANGVATLGNDGKIPSVQLPALAITESFVVGSEAEQLALDAQEGDVAVRTDLNQSFIHNGGNTGTIADWTLLLTPTDSVLSVNGQTGAVNLTKGDIGLGTVDNTSDLDKPVSTAAQAALGGKVTKGGDSGAELGIGTNTAHDLYFKVNNTTWWTIDNSTGYLRRGGGAANFGLQLYGTGAGSTIAFGDNFDASTPYICLREKGGSDTDQLEIYAQKGVFIRTGIFASSSSSIAVTQAGLVAIGTETAISGHALTIEGNLSLNGHETLQELSGTPPSPSSGTQCRIYMKADKFIIQYNDGGTTRYKYLDLTGTGITWVHTTVAP